MPPKIKRLSVGGECIAGNQTRTQFRQPPFLFSGEMSVEIFCYDKLENRIPQKFQTLIIVVISLLFMAETRVGQCLPKQALIAKMIVETVLEGFHVNVVEKPPAR
jgi:hypothetical protein